MYIMVLLIHIALASVTIITSFAAIHRAGSSKATIAVKRTWQSFVGTSLSGVGLVIIAPHTWGHFCVVASAYVVGIVLVQLYVRVKARELAV